MSIECNDTMFDEIIKDLYKIITELDARETSFNCIHAELTGHSWDELCDLAIKLIRKLGGTE